jgi:uncharacterized protein (UPF0264 family)
MRGFLFVLQITDDRFSMEDSVPVPRLLVSVRSPAEALAAVSGGAAIIDVKEPLNGPLGMASAEVCRSVADSLVQCPSPPPLSLALGELRDWQRDPSASDRGDELRLLTSALPGLTWLKCGLAGCRGNSNWVTRWMRFRESLPGPIGWVAVAYADAERAAAPDVAAVLQAALETRAAAILIDTFVKDQTRLFDWLPSEQLRWLCQASQAAGLPVALAGRLSMEDIPELLGIGPEIMAVRGAACTGNNRVESVCVQRVSELTRRLGAGE